MSFHNIFLKLSLIFAETCFIVLLYFCVVGSFKGDYLVSPAFFFILTAGLTIANILISYRSFRHLTILLINLFLIGLIVGLAIWQTGFILFSIPRELLSAVNVILVDCSIVWLAYRSFCLAYKKNTNVYVHFDICVIFTLLVILIMGFVKISLPGGMTWIITALFLNVISLYINNNTGSNTNPLSRLILAFVAIGFLYLSVKTVLVFPQVTGTAGVLFDFIKNCFLFIGHFLAYLLLFLCRLMYAPRTSNSVQDQQSPTATGTISTDFSWLDVIFQGGMWILGIFLALIMLAGLYSMLRLLISFLLKRQGGKSYSKINNPLPSWRDLYVLIKEKIKRTGYFLLVFLPVGMPVYLAYRQLLWWGRWKMCPRQIDETPDDYCGRLLVKYPELSPEFKEITAQYVVYRYSNAYPANLTVPHLKPMVRKLYLSDLQRLIRFCRKILNKTHK